MWAFSAIHHFISIILEKRIHGFFQIVFRDRRKCLFQTCSVTGLYKKQIHVNGGLRVSDIYLTLLQLFLTNYCECIIAVLSEKGVSDWFYMWALKEIFETCVLSTSPVSWASHLLTVRKMSSVWQHYHVDMAGHRTSQKCLALVSTSVQQDSVREVDWYNKPSSAWELGPGSEKKTHHPNISRCVPGCWHLFPCPFVVSDTRCPSQLWVLKTLCHRVQLCPVPTSMPLQYLSNRGPHPTVGHRFPLVFLSPRSGMVGS